MNSEQINVGLAKWHSEHHKYGMKFVYGVCLDVTSACGTLSTLPLYTNSLDTMRLIEVLMTDAQRRRACCFCGVYYADHYMATSHQRARAAFYALGLGNKNE